MARLVVSRGFRSGFVVSALSTLARLGHNKSKLEMIKQSVNHSLSGVVVLCIEVSWAKLAAWPVFGL